jgi:CheY-like chemotaxis protein
MPNSALFGPDSRRRWMHLSIATAEPMNPHILVIDDEPVVREALTLVLRSAGYEVQCAVDGRKGLQAFRQRRPDIVISDIMMPEMEGLETIMQLRILTQDCPIIAISGGGWFGKRDFLHAAIELGATAALTKPFKSAELLQIVADCLAGRLADRRDLGDRRERTTPDHRFFVPDRRVSSRRGAHARVQ